MNIVWIILKHGERKEMAKNIFVAATRQNDGKTSLCLGLIQLLKKKRSIGFIKPVGQRYFIVKSCKIDEDALVMSRICGLKTSLEYMSPIAIERGFTEKYILKHKPSNLSEKIKQAYQEVSRTKEIVVVEGTGHAGVGSVFGLSNAYVAKLLNSKVLLVASGGIGRPIDEILLNKALFENVGVELLGVVINKVMPEKYNKINRLVRKRLAEENIDTFGVIPYKEILIAPTMEQVAEELDLEILSGEGWISNTVEQIIVGAMEPHEALRYIKDRSLVITPGDREDIILTTISTHFADKDSGRRISGMILTGNITPHKSIVNIIKKSEIPVLISSKDTYTIASNVHDLVVKLRPGDKKKADIITDLVEEHVDIDRLLEQIC